MSRKAHPGVIVVSCKETTCPLSKKPKLARAPHFHRIFHNQLSNLIMNFHRALNLPHETSSSGRILVRSRLVFLFPTLLLVGCGSMRRDTALGDVKILIHDRTGKDLALPHTQLEQRDVDARIAALLRKQLTADSAVQVALLNNRRLRATLEELHLSQADLLEASLPKNPSLAASFRFPSGGGKSNQEFGLAGDVIDWLLVPLRRKLALHEYEAAKSRVSHEVLVLAADVKAAFYEVQARQQFLRKLETSAEVNNVSSDIAERLRKAGNISELELLQEQTSAQQVALDLKRTQAELKGAREKVNRQLGLSSAEAARWTFAENLPSMPGSDPTSSKLESLALAQRQDLAAQKETVWAFEQAISLKRKTRLFPAVNLGVDTERDVDGTHVTGPTLDVEIPIFNRGQGRILRAQAELGKARATLEALQSEVLSDVRMALADVQAARETYEYLAKTLLPQHQKILGETLLHYNAMQVSSFVLLRAKENEVKAARETIEALRAYWTARAQLEKAVGGSLTANASPAKKMTAVKPTMKSMEPDAHAQHAH